MPCGFDTVPGGKHMRTQHACVATAAMLLVACGDLPHDNPRDPQAPADTQGRVTLVGTVTLEPPGGTPPSLSAVHVSVAGHSWAADTDADGHYEISGVPVGTWVVQFTRAGWDDQVVSGIGVTLDQAGEHIPLPPIELKVSRGNVAGTIALEGEDSAGGVAVSLEAVPSASSVHWASALAPGENSVLTDGAGRFVLAGIPVGEYVLRASKTGFLDGTVASVTVTPSGVTTLDRLLLFMNPGGFSGSVLVQGATSSTQVTVRASGTTLSGSPWESTVTDRSDGTYLLSGVPGGTYNVSFEREGCVPVLVGAAVRPGEVTALPPVLLTPATGVVTGSVALSAGAVAGFPVPADRSGIAVSLTGRDGSVNSVLTDAAGSYRFNDVPVSLDSQGYGVSARFAGYEQSAVVRVSPLARTAVSADPVTLQLAAGAIGGTVELWDNAGGAGVNASSAGTVISITGTAFDGTPWSTSATTGQDGSFLAQNLPRGTYDLTASSSGRACDPLPRTQVGYGAVATVAAVRCRDTVAPGSLVLGLPEAVAPTQPGFTSSTSVPVRLLTQAIDPTGNLRGYQTAVGATPDWTSARIVGGTPSTLPFTLSPDPVSRGNQKFVLWARAVDWTGNAGPAASVEIVYDDVAPGAPTISTPRTLVNATTTSVTLGGGQDPNFLRFEYRTTPCQGGGSDCPFVSTPATFAVSLPADQSTTIQARAVDWAGNRSDVTTLTVTSDMTPPRPPQMAPSYDPYRLTIRAPWVDFVPSTAAYDPPGSYGPWGGLAWLEVDTGSGFTPLCPAAECQDDGVWSPCTCECHDPRLLCRGSTFAGVRADLSLSSGSTVVSFRAVDLAGNVGPSTSQPVLAETTPDVLATATRTIVDYPLVRDGVVGYVDSGAGKLVDLGANRRADPDDPRCQVSNATPAYASVVPLARDVVAYGQTEVENGSSVQRLYLRLRGASSPWCSAGDTNLLIGGGRDVTYPAGDRRHVAWAERQGEAWRVMLREAPPDARVGTASDTIREIVPSGTFSDIAGIWLGGKNLLVVGVGGTGTTYRNFAADSGGSFLTNVSYVDLPLDAMVSTLTMSKDGSALIYQDNSSSLVVRTTGPGGVFENLNDLTARLTPPVPLLTERRLIDGRHAMAPNGAGYDGLAAFWDTGEDGVWGTVDDVAKAGYLSGTYRYSADIDTGLLVYSTHSSIELLDLSTLRWEVPLLHGLLGLGVASADTLISNGEDSILWADMAGDLWARAATGEQSVTGGSPSVMSSDGMDLLVEQAADHLTAYRAAFSSGQFFTPQAAAPAVIRAARPQEVRVGGGKAIVREFDTSSATGFRCWVLEPNLGSLLSFSTNGTAIDVQPSGCAWGSLGMTERQAFFPCGGAATCSTNADGTGRFTTGSLASTATLRMPTSSGIPDPGRPALQVRGTWMILSESRLGTVLLDAGPDGLFNTADDRARVLTPDYRSYSSELAVSGQWAAWLDQGAPGGDQVFVLHGFDGAPIQITSTPSVKSHVTVDRLGRVHWIDSGMTPQAIMTWEP